MGVNKKKSIILIALYDPNSLGICTLHAILKKEGFNVNSIFFKFRNPNQTMDYYTAKEIDTLVKLIKDLKPVLVGINVRTTFFKLACEITKEIKNNMDTLVAWGGVHPTIRPIQSIEVADIICIGEGEEAILELAMKLSKGKKIDDIQNLWVKKGDKIIKNDLRLLIENLDSIPFPDLSNECKFIVEKSSGVPPMNPEQVIRYGTMVSRGCFFKCTYCYNYTARKIYKGKGTYARRRSVENVIAELVYAKKRFKNLRDIVFKDDIFTVDTDWIKRFCNQYKKAINLPFFCYCQPNTANEEMIRLLKDAGVSYMPMGVQSGSERIRHKYFERCESNEETVKISKLLHKYKINHGYYLILDNPLEREEDKRETLNFLLKLPKPFKLHMLSLTYFPETKLTNFLLDKGIISENDVEDQKQKAYDRYVQVLDLRRDKENLLWENLYYLAGKRYFPKRFLVWLSRMKFLKKNPKILTLLLRLTSSEISTVRTNSKADRIRYYLIAFCHSPLTCLERVLLLLREKRDKDKKDTSVYEKIRQGNF